MDDDFQLFTSLRFDWGLRTIRDIHPRDLGWNTESPSPLYMLTYHRDRMLKAATHWNWAKAIQAIQGDEGLGRLNQFVHSTLKERLGERWGPDCEPMRLKVLLSRDGELALECSSVPATALSNLFPDQLPAPDGSVNPQGPPGEQRLGSLSLTPTYDVYIDTDFTPASEFTHFKTTKREMYDLACQRVGLKPSDATTEVLIVNQKSGVIMEGSRTTPYFWRAGAWVTPRVACSFDAQGGAGGQDGTTRRWALESNLAIEKDTKAAEIVDGEPVWLSNGRKLIRILCWSEAVGTSVSVRSKSALSSAFQYAFPELATFEDNIR
ncbi:Aminodeoxychorismate lyase [Gnomoniopsis sp. IMI 355080]|nr:Aminodeoxychorismate lyase [Gnomoniopsis sp. IMI 355080]